MKSIIMSGLVASEPQLRYTADNQTPICEFMLRLQNPKTSDSDVIKVVAWNNLAQELAETVHQATTVVVEGRLKTSVREVNEHKEKHISITASRVHCLPEVELNLNQVSLIGRLGQDPDVRYFGSGNVVSNFSVAVRGSSNSDPDWFTVELWGKTAEVAADYTRKGGQVGIIGQVVIDHWKDRTSGDERSTPVIKGSQISLISSSSPTESSESLDEF
ncbi:MAG: single-stranded DNA-binding protein [Cyanobacteria bacterium J06627_8]